MATLYPTRKDHDGFFDFLPSWFDEWGHNFSRNNSLQPFAADVQERPDAYDVKMDLPGFNKENIHIGFSQGILTVDASREQRSDEKAEDGSFIRKERATGSYTRRFRFDDVNEDAIKAEFSDGVLGITLPKKETKKSNRKEININ
ncbi:Hsp20/alpha crystallin family protein [Sporolactobacillus terrae]|uniref:Hsp20/alpha crystallin family protein n=1 Tax=Sporolactobacillus terrae TaxID=269673 RepID=A0A410D9B9_9BACL|nr:Hsp20/alpha crystallin family protein [Sporolactobacillus terrae]QAA22693.1 Hsp20/alpha crystallin family protein [Sporolactobacillus terrae]QAA25666.1 Hsp20/alpha crystallin family protein [Sporolactobacillus terrae]UAK17477.1 Hsp20/alpha crystallin family protein [Sporolactobacillus terrae]BBN99022.1 molecular chaperone [Sporolactobacillus terrae]